MIPAGGVVTIEFADDSLQLNDPPSDPFCQTADQSRILPCQAATHSSGLIRTITIQDLCGTNTLCPPTQSLSFRVSDVRNPRSTKPIIDSFQVRSFTADGFSIDTGSMAASNPTDLALEPASFSLVTLEQPDSSFDEIVTGAIQQSYLLRIELLNGLLPNDGRLVVTFPEALRLKAGGTSSSCQAYTESGNEFLNCEIHTSSLPHKVVIKHSKENVDYRFMAIIVRLVNNVRNPPSTKPSSPFSMQSELYDSASSTYYLVDKNAQEVKIAANKPNKFAKVSITRSEDEVSSFTNLRLCMTTSNTVQPGAQLTIVYPRDQALLSGTQVYQASSQRLTAQTRTNFNSQMAQVDLKNAIAEGSEYCIDVSGGILNPGKTSPPSNSFQLILETSDGYKIDETLSNIFAEPYLSAGPFLSANIESSGSEVGGVASIESKLVLKSPLPPNSLFFVKLPSSAFYLQESDSAIECSINSASYATCSDVSIIDDARGSYLDYVRISTGSRTYFEGDTVVIRLRNLRNKFDSAIFSSSQRSALVQSYDDNNYTINTSSLSMNMGSLSPNGAAKVLEATRSDLGIQQSSTVELAVQTETRLISSSVLTVHLSQLLFDVSSVVNHLSCNLEGRSTLCSLERLDSSFYVVSMEVYCPPAASGALCPDQYQFQLSITGLRNRYSTYRGSGSGVGEVYVHTYDPSGKHQIDYSPPVAFQGELVPGEATLDIGSLKVTERTVGQGTEFTFTVVFAGLKTQRDDIVQLDFNQLAQESESGRLFRLRNGQKATIYANERSESSQIVTTDPEGFVTALQTKVPASSGKITIKLTGVANLGRVQPLKSQLKISIKDPQGGQVASGQSQIQDFDILKPVMFTKIKVERKQQSLSSVTDIVVELNLDEISILPMSVLQMTVPKEQLRLSGGGRGTCLIEAQGRRTSDSCRAEVNSKGDYVITTNAMVEGAQGTTMRLLISSIFANPNQITYSNASISLAISNQGFSIGSSDPAARIFVEPPLQKDELTQVAVEQSGLTAGLSTELTFSFKLKNEVPYDSMLIFSMPAGILLHDLANGKMICEARSVTGRTEALPCEVQSSLISDRAPEYVTEVRVNPNSRSYLMYDFMKAGNKSEIILKNAFNADFVKDRSASSSAIQVSVVSSGGFVVAQGSLQESDLPSLEQASVKTASMTRKSIRLGATEVEYRFTFEAASLMQRFSYALLHIPKNEVKVREDDLTCQIAGSLRNLRCDLSQQTAEEYYVIRIGEICKYDFCRKGEVIDILLNLANSNSIVFEDEQRAISFEVLTQEDFPIQALSRDDVTIRPVLEGSVMRDFEIERKFNRIGELDLLKFYLPPIDKTLFIETHLILELPQGVAYQPEQYLGVQTCIRELDSGQQVQLDCDSFALPSSNSGQLMLRSVRLRSICNQYHHCERGEPITFAIGVRNPNTNIKMAKEGQRFKVVLREESGLDVGYGKRDLDLPLMLPSSAFVTMQPYSRDVECQRLGSVCHLLLKVTTSNTLKPQTTGAYLQIQIPRQNFEVRGSECWAFINDDQGRPLSCYLTRNLLQIRAADYDSENLSETGNSLKVIIASVRMPLTTLPVGNAIVKNFEMTESQVFSLIDSNMAEPGTSLVTTLPGRFASVDVRRQSNEIGARNMLGFSLLPKYRKAIPLDETEVFLEVKLPASAGRLERVACFSDSQTPVPEACRLQRPGLSDSSSHATLVVRSMKQFCPRLASVSCRILVRDFVNSWYATDEEELARDSFGVTMFYFLTDGTKVTIFEDAQSGIFARPKVEPLDIAISKIRMVPSPSQTAQKVSLAFEISGEQDQVFDASPYLLARFALDTYKPVLSFEHKTEVYINGQKTKFRLIQTVDRDVDLSIKAMYLDLPELDQGTKVLDIKLIGFQNPNFVNSANLAGAVQISVLGGSVARTEIRAQALAHFQVDLKPYGFKQLSLFSTTPWPAESTILELDWSMTNKINFEEVYQVEIRLPDGFRVPAKHFECENLFNGKSVPCILTEEDKIVVGLQQTRTTTSQLSFTAVGLKFGPVWNPNRVIDQAAIQVRVLQAMSDKIYVEGSVNIAVLAKGSPSACPEGCQDCTEDGKCITCEQPSTMPLLAQGECHSVCPEGSFASGDRCLSCNSECSTCHSLDQCSSCYKDDSTVFIDGRCLPECPEHTVMVMLTEPTCVRSSEPISLPNADSDNELPIFQVDETSADVPEPCRASNCNACGLSEDFCTQCETGFVRHGGSCVSQCADGLFSALGICFRCSPLCQTCSDTANQCDSCPEDGISAFTKLLPDQRMCAAECPPGTYEDYFGTCMSCGDTCNTCKEGPNQCNSCFHDKNTFEDLYLFEGTCIEECPKMTRRNHNMHRCDSLESEDVFSFSNWPIVLIIILAAFSASMLAMSRIVSQWSDKPWELAAALLSVMEGVIKVILWVTLWQSRAAILFAFTGVSILCSALLSVFFYETTVLPVYVAMKKHRQTKGATVTAKGQIGAFRAVRVLAYVTSMTSARLLASSFCGLEAFKLDLSDESPCFFLKRRVQASKAQLALTALWALTALASMFTPGMTGAAVGAGFASSLTALASIVVQLKTHWTDRQKAGGYRTLMTQD